MGAISASVRVPRRGRQSRKHPTMTHAKRFDAGIPQKRIEREGMSGDSLARYAGVVRRGRAHRGNEADALRSSRKMNCDRATTMSFLADGSSCSLACGAAWIRRAPMTCPLRCLALPGLVVLPPLPRLSYLGCPGDFSSSRIIACGQADAF